MQEIANKRVLIIPDSYIRNGSGAAVTRVLVSLFTENGFKVAVLSSEFKEFTEIDTVSCYPGLQFSGFANIRSKHYLKSFKIVLNDFKPSHLFFIGSISNKPICYLKEGLRDKLNISVFIFMQDFFCAKFYANDRFSPCTKCLVNGLHSSFFSCCGANSIGFIKLLERYRARIILKRLLPKVSHLGTSTEEQVNYYTKFGVPLHVTFKLPLLFDNTKLLGLKPSRGDYFLGIAQNRIEKGFHLIPEIIKHTKSQIILAYYDEKEANESAKNPCLKQFIVSGQLKIVASSWETGLGSLLSNSQGVIIPSIWPSTTEFGWLEALALGKPTITFDVGIHHEVIENRINGMISPVGDYSSMGENIDYIDSLSTIEYETIINNVKKLYNNLSNRDSWIRFIDSL